MNLCKIWMEQCEAARGIEDEFGTQKALAYLVGEKFLNYLEAAEKDSTFQAELPAFVAEIKKAGGKAETKKVACKDKLTISRVPYSTDRAQSGGSVMQTRSYAVITAAVCSACDPPPAPLRNAPSVSTITSYLRLRLPASSVCGYTTSKGNSNCSNSQRVQPEVVRPPY